MRVIAGEENQPRIARIGVPYHCVSVSLPPVSHVPLFRDGIAWHPGELATHSGAHMITERTDGPSQWRAIVLLTSDLMASGKAISGKMFAMPSGTHRWHPPKGMLRELIRLHDAAIRVTRRQPRVTTGTEAARGLEQLLLHALVDCFPTRGAGPEPASPFADLVNRFSDFISGNPGRTDCEDAACAAFGVGADTLNACCEAYLGMTPARYLQLRRLQIARRALGEANPNISEIAARCGFDNVEALANAYRVQFGEPLPLAKRVIGMPRRSVRGHHLTL